MADRSRSKIIKENPIGKGLDAFRGSFNENRSIPYTPDALGQLGQEGRTVQHCRSCTPLTIMQISKSLSVGITAIRDIEPGDEITLSCNFTLHPVSSHKDELVGC